MQRSAAAQAGVAPYMRHICAITTYRHRRRHVHCAGGGVPVLKNGGPPRRGIGGFAGRRVAICTFFFQCFDRPRPARQAGTTRRRAHPAAMRPWHRAVAHPTRWDRRHSRASARFVEQCVHVGRQVRRRVCRRCVPTPCPQAPEKALPAQHAFGWCARSHGQHSIRKAAFDRMLTGVHRYVSATKFSGGYGSSVFPLQHF